MYYEREKGFYKDISPLLCLLQVGLSGQFTYSVNFWLVLEVGIHVLVWHCILRIVNLTDRISCVLLLMIHFMNKLFPNYLSKYYAF